MISILIPTYKNTEKQLDRLSKSLKGLKDTEVLVCVDDDDNEYIEKVKKYFSNVIYQKNQGTYKARKLLTKQAKGDWIFFIDADDEATPELIDFINNNSLDEKYVYYTTKCKLFGDKNNLSLSENKSRIENGDSGLLWGKFIQKKVLEEIHNILPNYKYKLWFGEEIPQSYYLEKFPHTKIDITTINYYDEGTSSIRRITDVNTFRNFLSVIQIMSFYGKDYVYKLIEIRTAFLSEEIRPECIHLFRRFCNKLERMDKYIQANISFKTMEEIDKEMIEQDLFGLYQILEEN